MLDAAQSTPTAEETLLSGAGRTPRRGLFGHLASRVGLGLTAFAAWNAIVFAVTVAVALLKRGKPEAAPSPGPARLWVQDDLDFARVKFPGETLVMADEFNSFDMSMWRHEITAGGGGNNEYQAYINNRTNSYVRNGVLYLRPNLTSQIIPEAAIMNGGMLDLRGTDPASLCTAPQWDGCLRMSFGAPAIINPVTSARINTANTFSFRYGRVEVKARMPRGEWLWPAIWMLPAKQQYGIWPASGEIDIVESRGNAPSYGPGGRNWWASTLHWGPDYSANRYGLTSREARTDDLSSAFHIYGLVWSERELYTYIDVDDAAHRQLYVDFTTPLWTRGGFGASRQNPWQAGGRNAPFDTEFYLIMNVAVGGGFFPGSPGFADFWAQRGSWLPTWDGENAALAVDYVRVWQRRDCTTCSVLPRTWGLGSRFFGPRLPNNASSPVPSLTPSASASASASASRLPSASASASVSAAASNAASTSSSSRASASGTTSVSASASTSMRLSMTPSGSASASSSQTSAASASAGAAIGLPSACGDGNCVAADGETCSTCPEDCGPCRMWTPTPTPPPVLRGADCLVDMNVSLALRGDCNGVQCKLDLP